MTNHKTGTREEWLAARLELLKAEKEVTRRGDELARRRQELPWVRIEKDYRFETDDGKASLADLFRGRSQLLIYHFMFGPNYTAGCPACSFTADSFNGALAHLRARDATLVCVSRAPIAKLLAYRKRMGWSFDWVSSDGSDFNLDFGVSPREAQQRETAAPVLEANELKMLRLLNEEPAFRDHPPLVAKENARSTGTNLKEYVSEGHGFSTFAREGDVIYHCYSTYARGTEFLMGCYAILDRAPKGRDEGDEAMAWLRRHDEDEKGTWKNCCR